MLDLFQLLPHAKKDAKLDTKSPRTAINEVADLKGCSSVLLFEARKRQDLYLWLARTPEGPSAKFLVHNVHTMAELKLSGNHLKGSRPVLSFHGAFDAAPHWRLVKEMLMQSFATPRRHPRSKPFVDHVLAFSIADGKVWARNYQIVPPTTAATVAPGEGADAAARVAAAGAKAARAAAAAAAGGSKARPLGGGDLTLVEVGPRFCLEPIKLFAGSCGGRVLYDNADFVSPNAVRAALKKKAAGKYGARVAAHAKRKARRAAVPVVEDEMAGVFK
jgi:ribosome biogenesis protein BRX1